jgi:mercuric ion binding protein
LPFVVYKQKILHTLNFIFMFKYILTFLLGFCLQVGIAQSKTSNNDFAEVKIKTSAQCEMCKSRIEKALKLQKGVKTANLDVETKILTVVYKTAKVDVATIKGVVTKTGYDADEIKADETAYKKLPACCQVGGH